MVLSLLSDRSDLWLLYPLGLWVRLCFGLSLPWDLWGLLRR